MNDLLKFISRTKYYFSFVLNTFTNLVQELIIELIMIIWDNSIMWDDFFVIQFEYVECNN